MVTSVWRPIEDLPKDWRNLCAPELSALAPIWEDKARRLADSKVLADFNARLQRQWAIETGIIEGLYSIDRGTTRLLIEQGLDSALVQHGTTDKPAEQVLAIVRDQQGVLELLFDFVGGTRELSLSFIKEIHAAFTRHQPTTEAIDQLGRKVEVPLLSGEWKEQPNNPQRNGEIYEYCPPLQVQSEMERLLAMHAKHNEVCPEVSAAWFHHRFTQIHPFQDGNGRVARALGSLLFIKSSWFPLTIVRDDRKRYIEALERADQGDLGPLAKMFAKVQTQAFLKATSLASDVVDEQRTSKLLMDSALDRLRDRFAGTADETKVEETASKLLADGRQRMVSIAEALKPQLEALRGDFAAFGLDDDGERSHWYRGDLVSLAKTQGYFADFRTFYRWHQLSIHEARSIDIVLCFHAIGRESVGLVGAVLFLKIKEAQEDGERTVEGPILLTEEIFQLTSDTAYEEARPRFMRWLEEGLMNGLETWRRGI